MLGRGGFICSDGRRIFGLLVRGALLTELLRMSMRRFDFKLQPVIIRRLDIGDLAKYSQELLAVATFRAPFKPFEIT